MRVKPGYDKLDDMELTACLAEGDHAAFKEIYNRHWRSLLTYARSILNDRDEAADVVQDIFTNLWNRTAHLQITTSLRAYLLTATRHQALKMISKTKRADEYAEELAACFDEEAGGTDEQANFRELCTILDNAVEKLTVTMRTVYIMHKEEALSHRLIARDLGITEQSSRTILNRAVASLRTKLSPLLSFLLLFWAIQK